jgi:hypothetical protein
MARLVDLNDLVTVPIFLCLIIACHLLFRFLYVATFASISDTGIANYKEFGITLCNP